MKNVKVHDLDPKIAIRRSKIRVQKLQEVTSFLASLMLITGIALFITSVFGDDKPLLSKFILMGITLLLILIVSVITIWMSLERSKQEKMENQINEHK